MGVAMVFGAAGVVVSVEWLAILGLMGVFAVGVWSGRGRGAKKNSWGKALTFSLAVTTFLLISMFLHEVGHALAYRLFGVSVKEAGLTFLGAYVGRSPLPAGQELVVCLAGPLVNLFLAYWLGKLCRENAGSVGWVVYRLNLVLGIINLMPIVGFDGDVALGDLLLLAGVGAGQMKAVEMFLNGASLLMVFLVGTVLITRVLLGPRGSGS